MANFSELSGIKQWGLVILGGVAVTATPPSITSPHCLMPDSSLKFAIVCPYDLPFPVWFSPAALSQVRVN